MGEPKAPETDVLFVGKTGVGKSSLINMIRGVDDRSSTAAEVSNNARPCTAHTTSYSMQLETGLTCQLWDTRGMDEAVDNREGFMARIVDKIADRLRQLASQQTRELRETLRDRTRLAIPILMWCMDAAKIDTQAHWQQFQRVYVDYCERKAIPVVVITRMSPKTTEWEIKCRNQLERLDLGGGTNPEDVRLLRVREYRRTSSPEYNEDSRILRDLISELTKR